MAELKTVPRGWLEALEQGEAELASGQAVPAAVVHKDLEDAIARIKAKHAAKQPAHS